MHIVFINPIASEKQLCVEYRTLLRPVPHIGLAYLAAVLVRDGHTVEVVDQFALHMSNAQLLTHVASMNPECVAFSCLTPCVNNVITLSHGVRSQCPDARILYGNLHATIYADALLQQGCADFIVRGEGELPLRALMNVLEKGLSLHGIAGISFRDAGAVVHNPECTAIVNLDDLPYPAWDLFDLQLYKDAPMLGLREVSLPIMASRGCSDRCSFCAQNRVFKGMRVREIEAVVTEIEYMYATFKVRSFVFCDSNFPVSIQYGIDFCKAIRDCGLHTKVQLTTELRLDLVSDALLKEMKSAGFRMLMLGFESGDQDVLDRMHKRMKIERAYDAMRIIKRHNLLTLGFFILGMPGDTKESCIKTITFAKKLRCDFVKFNIAIPYPGTQFFDEEIGELSSDMSFEDFTSWQGWLTDGGSLPYVPERMSEDVLLQMQSRAMFSFYMQPHVIVKHLVYGTLSLRDMVFGGVFLIRKRLRIIMRLLFNGRKKKCVEG
jgi:radical SAM superfamily enzyme YgiQ (UPF0313 family)